jgi:hypothetical protein
LAKAPQQVGIFKDVLENCQDISDIYYNDRALQRRLSDDSTTFDGLLQKTREQMQEAGAIKRISEIDSKIIQELETQYAAGCIAAVDGTDAISPTESTSKTIYAAGVISVTAKTLNSPRITMTESHRQIPQIDDNEDFFKFVERLDRWVDHDQSWVRTFREHCERTEAMRLISDDAAALVLIDGPLYTQNLLTQITAQRSILDEMQNFPDRLIGFIKNMSSSKIMQLAGMALQRDEYWTIDRWREVLANTRFKSDRQKQDWINSTRSDWVRTIYKKNKKAYAFECHPDLIDAGIGLVASSVTCAAVVNHEIPFLLHCADRIIQARVNAVAKGDNLISSSPFYVDLANERLFR